jgi:nucleotide-binding universal stress UspA family protein
MSPHAGAYALAIQDFRQARLKSSLEQIMARLTRQSTDLLSFEDVRQKLGIHGKKLPHIKEIPIDAIIGSVGRQADFTRSFLPKRESDAQRWAGVKVAVTDSKGLPPISVYQIGDAYFVEDGHHRISVARQLGQDHIEAYVTEMETRVPLEPGDKIDDLILKAEYLDYLEHTRLDKTKPSANLKLTIPAGYQMLEERVAAFRKEMESELQREIASEEAAGNWYDEEYLPVVDTLRKQGILQDFPGRTETDLYLCISDHRESLRDTLKMEIDAEGAVSDLACNFSHELEQVEPLFADILVPISGAEPSFQGLEQASVIARREEARVYGLHVVAAEEDERSASAKAVRAEFEKRCTEAGVQGYLAVTVGDVPRMICDRAHFTNLVVMKISCPPPPQPLARLSSGVSTVIRRCSRPILVVPRSTTPLDQALLAYDGSAKAREALYIASYLAAQWDIPLAVLSVRERGFSAERAIQEAQGYLEGHGVQAKSVIEDGPVVEAIFKTVQLLETNLIVMGGYGHALLPEMVLGSTVDQVLRTSGIPVLICH